MINFQLPFWDFLFLSLTMKTWFFILISILSTFFMSYFCSRAVNYFLFSMLSKTHFSKPLLEKNWRFNKSLMIIFLGWFFLISLAFYSFDIWLMTVAVTTAKIIIYIGVLLLGWRFVDLFGFYMLEKSRLTESKFDDLLAPFIMRLLKVIVFILILFSVAELLELPLTSLIAGLGIGGLAVAMAAKETIENLFGSVTVISDRPFDIGDWIKMSDVEGTVETMGFRSTRVRTFYGSLVTIPNSKMLKANVDNLGKRPSRRYVTKLGVVYATPPDKIDAFCEAIRTLILTQPLTQKEGFYVHLNDFSDSSIQILVYMFFKVGSYNDELAARHDFLNGVLKIAVDLGIEFAFPTRTLYLEQSNT